MRERNGINEEGKIERNNSELIINKYYFPVIFFIEMIIFIFIFSLFVKVSKLLTPESINKKNYKKSFIKQE